MFRLESQLKRHNNDRHSTLELKLVKCSQCQNCYKAKGSLKVHVQKKHQTPNYVDDIIDEVTKQLCDKSAYKSQNKQVTEQAFTNKMNQVECFEDKSLSINSRMPRTQTQKAYASQQREHAAISQEMDELCILANRGLESPEMHMSLETEPLTTTNKVMGHIQRGSGLDVFETEHYDPTSVYTSSSTCEIYSNKSSRKRKLIEVSDLSLNTQNHAMRGYL